MTNISLKPSRYNLIYQIGEDKQYVLYNTLRDQLLVVDDEARDLLERPDNVGQLISSPMFRHFRQLGLVVDSDLDEIALAQAAYEEQRENTERAHIMLTATYSCNATCTYCFVDKTNVVQYLDNKTIQKIRSFVESVVRDNDSTRLQIDFFGGEPLLRWKTMLGEVDYYNYWARGLGLEFTFRAYTNLMIFPDELCERLADLPLKDLQVTLDGPQEDHDQRRMNRAGGGTFERIVGNLQRALSYEIPIRIRINFDTDNYLRMDALLDDLQARGLDEYPVDFYPLQAMSPSSANYEHAVMDEDLNEILPILWRKAVTRGFKVSLKPRASFLYCSAFTESAYIVDYRGDVYKCAIRQSYPENKAGILDDSGAMTEKTAEYDDWMNRDPFTIPQCKVCKLMPICSGGCAGAAKEKYGTFHVSNCMDVNDYLVGERLLLHLATLYPDVKDTLGLGGADSVSINTEHVTV